MIPSGVILAGGQSTRMGTNKSLLMLNGRPIIQHIADEMQSVCDEMMIVTNDKSLYEFLDIPMLEDNYPGMGPLAGLQSALASTNKDRVCLIACDTPFISKELYAYLDDSLKESYQGVVPVYQNKTHPLSGIYQKDTLPIIENCLNENQLRFTDYLNNIPVNYVETFHDVSNEEVSKHFFNMNTPDDFEVAKTFFKEKDNEGKTC
ncbi:molybdenum cofactor guanylyltransferase [Aquibacillus sp. 3ASR75-11]|uniref:Probable molybdenum cofactor guanylyltransferase n=1 Tax=Terrihalobacillus insolitus TaxID=2950438 RepID=A0A9X4ALY9_9BACI|nr:molybdenum cofactor guanylyltransferase [Terrihalobacillus insolitus]MDC3412983.1 molybdenum cofactor guanylyltransferase [Terrihalobacillus insolitus]MDC3424736.1 molybdenum cofactor guanylyltransferase [Terrihalobacillus insolitus]